ncbi:MAG: hypothetical protein A2Z06_03680 [Candidatus Glassbacteria bacterium RBG_16_58_8]|uniref:Uncharacterized protein n=1 Tax=Candidatus Glassbacteria bacterium RBG_16_58_8 TaxID=1817866 RepID=A0A1F5YDL0_9BACT|nr:MAG: hypothetical protein A2Z06_03680 [Candidatus Glassbacteria bacterium RBG_16_58_8]
MEGGIALRETGYIDFGSWRIDSDLILVAVNLFDGDVDGTFLLGEGAYEDSIEVLFEGRAFERGGGDRFTDHFAPFETHIYRLKTHSG